MMAVHLNCDILSSLFLPVVRVVQISHTAENLSPLDEPEWAIAGNVAVSYRDSRISQMDQKSGTGAMIYPSQLVCGVALVEN